MERANNSSQLIVAGIGEVLWDILETSEELGGAPVNFAYHITMLGGYGLPVSSIGSDERGQRTLHALEQRKLPITAISEDPDHPTGVVLAKLDANGVATYEFPDAVAWDYLRLTPAALETASSLRAVCFGSLAQRSPETRKAIQHFLELTPSNGLRIFDLNLRQDFYTPPILESSLRQSDVLKLNDDELYILARLLDLHGNDCEQLATLLSRYTLKLVALTRGRHGSLIITPDALVEHPGIPSRVADTIGAGDAFTAAITLGMLLQHSPEAISEHANKLAAYVCSQSGAMPPIPEKFKLT